MSSEWPTVKIGDVCVRVTKGTTPTTGGGAFSKSGIAFIKVEAITESGGFIPEKFAFIDTETDEKLSRSRLKEDDILFTIAGTIGRVAHVTSSVLPGNTNQAVAIVRPNRDLIYPRYLYYTLRDRKRIQLALSKVVQSVQANFSLGELSAIELPLPSQTEQRAIAHILGTLDDKIELNRKMNETLESMARALFKSWFIDFDPVRAKMDGRWKKGQSLPGLPAELWGLFPSELIDLSNGQIPKSWELGTISDVADVLGGGTPSTTNDSYYSAIGEGIPWLSPKDLSGYIWKYIERGAHDISQAGLEGSSAVLLPAGTVLFSSRAPIGYVAIAEREVTTNQGFKSLVPRRHLGSNYFYYWLKENTENIEGRASGSTFKEISGGEMKKLPLCVPSEVIAAKFEELLIPSSNRQRELRHESSSLVKMRDALLPRLISGVVTIAKSDQFLKERGL